MKNLLGIILILLSTSLFSQEKLKAKILETSCDENTLYVVDNKGEYYTLRFLVGSDGAVFINDEFKDISDPTLVKYSSGGGFIENNDCLNPKYKNKTYIFILTDGTYFEQGDEGVYENACIIVTEIRNI